MAFFDDLGRKFSEAGQKVLQKTGEMSDTSRLNMQINEEERRIDGLNMQLGKLYMSLHRDDPEPEMASVVQAIINSEKNVQGYRQQLQVIKGMRSCPKCGGEVSVNSAFCTYCGNPMPVEKPPANPNFTICQGCGGVIEDGMRFCTQCGRPVVRPAVPMPGSAGAYPPPAAPTQEAPGAYPPPAAPVQKSPGAYPPPAAPTQEAPGAYPPPAAPVQESPGAYPPPAAPVQETPGAYPPPAAPVQEAPGAYPPPAAPVQEAPGAYPPPAAPAQEAPGAYPPPAAPVQDTPEAYPAPETPMTESEAPIPAPAVLLTKDVDPAGSDDALASDLRDADHQHEDDRLPIMDADVNTLPVDENGADLGQQRVDLRKPEEDGPALGDEMLPADTSAPIPPVDTTIAPLRFCPACGAPVESGDAFCMNCGTKL